MLPGSHAVHFTTHTFAGRYDDASIDVQSLETGKRKTLWHGGYYGRYLPSGHLVFMRHNTLYAAPTNLKRAELTGPAVAVLNDVVGDADIGRIKFSFAETGAAVCQTGTWQPPEFSLTWRDESGRGDALPVVQGAYADPRVSFQGNGIALSVGEGSLNRRQVAILDLPLGRSRADGLANRRKRCGCSPPASTSTRLRRARFCVSRSLCAATVSLPESPAAGRACNSRLRKAATPCAISTCLRTADVSWCWTRRWCVRPRGQA